MSHVFPGRFSADMPDSFVVFHIGMRINKWLSVGKWLPAFRAMPAMIKELSQHPELGFLGTEMYLGWRGAHLVQYWRSFDDLQRYAHGDLHMKAWRAFYQSAGGDGSVGIYHETYLIQAGQYEALYVNMPRFGLAKAAAHVALDRGSTAAKRLAGKSVDHPPTDQSL